MSRATESFPMTTPVLSTSDAGQTETDLLSLYRLRFKEWTERTTRRDEQMRSYRAWHTNHSGPGAA